MRIGLMIGPERGRYRKKVTQLASDAAEAERAGFTSVWAPQIPGEFDAFTTITLMGQATERIELGTAVVPIQTRHPIAMAQETLSVQAVCDGRFTLGIGVSHEWIIKDQLGLSFDRPARLMRSYLEVLTPALAGPGTVVVENDHFRVNSPMDVTAAMSGTFVWESMGYQTETARHLAANVVLWRAGVNQGQQAAAAN